MKRNDELILLPNSERALLGFWLLNVFFCRRAFGQDTRHGEHTQCRVLVEVGGSCDCVAAYGVAHTLPQLSAMDSVKGGEWQLLCLPSLLPACVLCVVLPKRRKPDETSK